MARTFHALVRGLVLCGLIFTHGVGASAQRLKEPVDYVNPNIGTIGHLLTATAPTVQLPHGMVRLAPITTPGITDRYLADKIYGFPAGGLVLMPTSGSGETNPARYASLFDHELETATPYYYAVTLETYDINLEYTVTERAAYYRVSFPANAEARILFSVLGDKEITVLSPTSLAGYDSSGEAPSYFYVELSRPIASSRAWRGPQVARGRWQPAGPGRGVIADFAPLKGEQVGLRIGTSYISIDQARQNLAREIPEWDFERVRRQARSIWNKALSKVLVEGGTGQERTVFYTALYRSMSRMVNITEGGRYYSGYDRQVHPAAGHAFYVDDHLWDTYRSMHPLQMILDPERQVDMVASYLRMYDQSGWLPSVPTLARDRPSMIAHHAAAFITDTYIKGGRNFDVSKAYEAMRKNALEATVVPWYRGPMTALDRFYQERGFFPALLPGERETVKEVHSFERRQSVSVTLENCYDDWCVAQFARVLGKQNDYALLMQRARNYAKVFDQRIGFMAPKTTDGNWIVGFDPKLSGGQGGRDYFTECNAWIYTFHVQHDVAGLIDIMGGRAPFIAKLDALFTEQYGSSKYAFLAQFPDMTGLIGQYAQGDEPSFHIPYLYNYAGEPWKTQRRLREIMKIWFNDGPLGIPGDDDGGAMSSWYVFSAMGFYPVCPGRPVYDLGSPLFDKVSISLTNGRVFTITAKNVSARNKYIQSAELNGKPLNKPWFEHTDLVNGGKLVVEMGPRPNRSWGSTPDAAPPSMSTSQKTAVLRGEEE